MCEIDASVAVRHRKNESSIRQFLRFLVNVHVLAPNKRLKNRGNLEISEIHADYT